MCGFLCVVTKRPIGEAIDLPRLNRDVLRHRGPDSSGDLLFAHAYVRHWRLSIVDLSETSSQPHGDGNSWLIYNGEIYNYEELAARLAIHVPGDTPLLYELCKRGIDREELRRVRGFYSFLYLTDNGRDVSGARDPFGKKPLFYYVDDEAGMAVFASEETAIVDCLDRAAIDFGAVSQYLLYKQTFHGRTYFSGIKQLAPGARFHFDTRRWVFSVDRDWTDYYNRSAADVFSLDRFSLDRPSEVPPTAREEGRIDSLVDRGLREALALRVPKDVSACVALSGGIDSSLIARFAVDAEALDHISQFVTVGFSDSGCDESSKAAEIARTLGVSDKHSIVPFPEGEMLALLRQCIEQAASPLEHPHYLSYYVLCRYAARFSKVLITGEGADELFMGYEHYRSAGASFAFREYLSSQDEAEFTAIAPGRPFDGVRREAGLGAFRTKALSTRMWSREYELKTHLLTLLSRNDKMGMANSVEIRAPFLDNEIVECAQRLSESDLVVDGSPKKVLKRIFSSCFRNVALPERKIGFRVPFDEIFLAGRHADDIRDCCQAAARALRRECGLTLASIDAITPRLGWSLVNIGMFLDAHGYCA